MTVPAWLRSERVLDALAWIIGYSIVAVLIVAMIAGGVVLASALYLVLR